MRPHLPPPRSVYLAFEAFPRPKGASSHIGAMLKALAQCHSPVLLLCLGLADQPALQVEDGMVIRRFKNLEPNLLDRIQGFGRFVHQTLRSLDPPPELLVFRDPWGGAPALSARPDVPAVFEVNALPRWELPYAYPGLAGNSALRAKIEDLELFCLRAAGRILTVSAVTARALIKLGVGAEKIFVVPNAAPEAFFRAETRENDAAPGQPRRFGYFGSLHPWQGVEVLLRAWALVAADWPKARLDLIPFGRKEALKDLRRLIRKLGLDGRVTLRRPLPLAELASTAAGWEFSCAPLLDTPRNTRQGCCPVKVVESLAAGVPVLGSDLEVLRELVVSGREGLLVRPGQVRAWALGISRLLARPELRADLAQGARRQADRRFTQRVVFAKLEQVFDSARKTV